MNGEVSVLPLMYSATITSSGYIYAESNDIIISTLCLKTQLFWLYESVECDVQIQLHEVAINKLLPLKYDFAKSNVRLKYNYNL